jgi:predicted nuclease of predicted toxin-antitoxin system
VKLLFDENLSPRLVSLLSPVFPESKHVGAAGLHGQPDTAIWDYARQHNFMILSKDDDFRQRSFLLGAPPKVIWLSVGNAGTDAIAALLMQTQTVIEAFLASPEESLLILRPQAADK